MYRRSRFTITRDVVVNGERYTAWYNTMNDAFALLPAHESEALDLGRDDSEVVGVLAGENLVIGSEIDEQKTLALWLEQFRNNWQCVKQFVLVTRKCNLRCRYCIIEPENEHMTRETATATAAFFHDVIETYMPKMGIQGTFAGGEPLLNKEAILTIAGRTSGVCQQAALEYGFVIETNGTLLNPNDVKELTDVGLAEVRVSLAGPAQIHDSLRRTAQGSGTYHRIIENLKAISGLAPISIECQYDSQKDDFELLPAWMDELEREGIEPIRINYNPIHARRIDNRFEESQKVADISRFLNSESSKRGYPVYDNPPASLCIADLRSSFVIDTDGSMLPCYNLQSGEFTYGHVTDGEDFLTASQYLARDFPDRCLKECEMIPLCKGGCRLQALIDTSNFNGVSCRYEEFARVLGDYIDTKAKSALGQGSCLSQGEEY